jgi:hypothetical protein
MRQIEIHVRVKWWKKYKRLVLIPPRSEVRKGLINELSSANTYYGIVRISKYGEYMTFKVGVKFYTWAWQNKKNIPGLNTIFVIVETNCNICVDDIVDLVNHQGGTRGVLTLYLP